MKSIITLGLLAVMLPLTTPAESANIKKEYTDHCVTFSQRVNPKLKTDIRLQKKACRCILDKVESIGATEDDLQTIIDYGQEFDFTALPDQPTFEQILQAHVDIHRNIIQKQEDLEAFAKGMISCAMDNP